MNALKPIVSRAIVARRFATVASKSAVPPVEKYSLKKAWLSDPSTYPIIIIMGCAMTFMVGMGINALTTYKDVQIDPKKRNQKLQTWGTEEHRTILSRAIHWNSFQKNRPEGLGVDHKQWEEGKKEYNNEQ